MCAQHSIHSDGVNRKVDAPAVLLCIRRFRNIKGYCFSRTRFIEARLKATSRVQYACETHAVGTPLVNKLRNTIISTYTTSTVP